MVVGVCRLVLALPAVDSLKGKRAIVRRVLDRMRSKFNVAAAEVGALDMHRRAEIGFAVVSNDTRHVNSMVDTIVSYASGASEALLIDRAMEIVHVDAHLESAIDRSHFEPRFDLEDDIEGASDDGEARDERDGTGGVRRDRPARK